MNDLICYEPSTENRAYPDPTLLKDDRVLHNLLKTEEGYTFPSTSFVQKEITPDMRKIVAEWMMEVCEEQKCQDEVFPLAMTYMVRFLNLISIHRNQLQLLGTACMLLASKLREPRPITADTLVFYTDNSITVKELWQWELLVLSKLKWDVSAITPQDFLRHILHRLPVEDVGIDYRMVDSHAKTLIALCAREYEFSSYPASMIASTCVASALCGLGWISKSRETIGNLLYRLHDITSIEQDYLRTCLKQVEDMVYASTYSANQNETQVKESLQRPSEFTPPPTADKLAHTSAGTPTDVHDVRF